MEMASKLDVFYILKIAWMLFLKFFSKKISREIFNIGEDKEITILNFAKKIISLTKSKSKIIVNSKQLNKFKGYQDIFEASTRCYKIKKND